MKHTLLRGGATLSINGAQCSLLEGYGASLPYSNEVISRLNTKIRYPIRKDFTGAKPLGVRRKKLLFVHWNGLTESINEQFDSERQTAGLKL